MLRIPSDSEITGMDIADTGRPAYDGPAWRLPAPSAPTTAVGTPWRPPVEDVDTARGRVPTPGRGAAGHRAQGGPAFDTAGGRAAVEAVLVQVGERVGAG